MPIRMNIKSVSVIGVLVAMEIILARFFSIHTWNLKIGFSFIPVVVAAIFYGPVTAGLVAAIGDILGAILFPVGAFFPGFTITAFAAGVVFGLFLRKGTSVGCVVISVFITQIAGSLFVNTFWISFLYGSPYWPLFVTRLYQIGAMTAVQIISIIFIGKKLIPAMKNSFFKY